MTAATLVPVAEYLKSTGKPYREYRDGVVVAKSKPTKLRSILMTALWNLLRKQRWPAYVELTVRISPAKYLVPDVAVAEDFAGHYPTEPVRLCCEILSPEDRLGNTLRKCEEYHEWGVPYCWVIDPVKRSAWDYHREMVPKFADIAALWRIR
jgi:Uma2 family endonuclease